LVDSGYPDIKLTGISLIITKECEAKNIASADWVRHVLGPLGYTDSRFAHKEGGRATTSTTRNYFELDNEELDKEAEKTKPIIDQVKFVKDRRVQDVEELESNIVSRYFGH